jgi:hypothetical protein
MYRNQLHCEISFQKILKYLIFSGKKFVSSGIEKFIAVFTKVYHWALF